MRGPRVRVNGWRPGGSPRKRRRRWMRKRDGGESRKRRVRRRHEEGDGCAAIWFPIMGRRDAPLSSEQRPGHPTPSSPFAWNHVGVVQPTQPTGLALLRLHLRVSTDRPPSSFSSSSCSFAHHFLLRLLLRRFLLVLLQPLLLLLLLLRLLLLLLLLLY